MPSPEVTADPPRTPDADSTAAARICRPQDRLQDSSRAAYAADWGLFADWCAAAGHAALPADADTVIEFLDECPAAAATWARRVAAVNRVHVDAGHAPPGKDLAVVELVRAAAGKPALDPTAGRLPAARLAELVRGIPTAGWPAGLIGRRDRLLLVLAHAAGLTHSQLHELRTADLTVAGDILLIRTSAAGDPIRLPAAGAAGVCPVCVWLSWVRVLRLAARHPGIRILRDAFHRTQPVTASPGSAHRGHTPPPRVPDGWVFLAADRYGYLTGHQPLSIRSISRILAGHTTGKPPTYRFLEPPPAAASEPEPYRPPAARPARASEQTRAEYTSALHKKHRDLQRLARLDATFEDLDRRIEDLTAAAAHLIDDTEPM